MEDLATFWKSSGWRTTTGVRGLHPVGGGYGNGDERYRKDRLRDWAPIVLFAAVTIGVMAFIWSAKLAAWSTLVVTAFHWR